MIYSLYSISLRLKTPSQEGKKINFNDKEKDLFEALNEFNAKFRSWSKRLILTKIEHNFFRLILVVEKQKDKISTREIRSFTAYLNKEKNWSVYSRESSKLFEGIKFSKITFNEAKEIVSNISTDSTMYNMQEEDIVFLLQKEDIKEPYNVFLEPNDDLSDEQAVAIFNYLLKTRNLGSNNEDKKKTILQIKDLLIKWL